MKKTTRPLICVLILLLQAIILFAQEPVSIMQEEYWKHRHLFIPGSLEKATAVIPLKPRQIALSATVFGYLPYWEYPTAKTNLRYELLTHIALFDFEVTEQGLLIAPNQWPWTDVINLAHENGVKVIATMVNFNSSQIHTIITTSSVKESFFNNVSQLLENFQLDGVNIDFEGLNTSDRLTINEFMSDLTHFVHARDPKLEVSFAAPAVNWGGWNLPGLANACDYLFIMGYDFYGSWSTTSGPVAPLSGGSYHVTNTVISQYATILPDKLILGVPYYGKKWETTSQNAYSPVVRYIGSTYYRDNISQASNYGLQWDNTSKTPWYRYFSNGQWNQVWFDNDSSLALKYDLALSKNFQGVGMWALGQDGTREELWDLLDRYFTPGSTTIVTVALPDKFYCRLQPNPAHDKLIISTDLISNPIFSFILYDNLGRMVLDQPLLFGMSGATNRELLLPRLSNGIYYYRISNGSSHNTGRITILH